MNKAFIGIDVSKGYMDACLVNKQGKVVEHYEKLYECREHHDLLIEHFKDLLDKGYTSVYCGLESTGGYENNWFRTISDNNLDGRVNVVRINPKRIHHESRTNMTRTVTDPVAAFTIADHLRKNLDKLTQHPATSNEMYNARKLYKFICLLQKQKNQISNHLEKLIYENIPELAFWCKHGVPKWMLTLLKQYPGKDKLCRAHISKMIKINGLTKDRAETIKEKVKQGIGASEDQYSLHLIESLVVELAAIDEKINREKKYLIDNYQDDNVELLCSIPGIGKQSAVTLLIEIEDLDRFMDASALASYFGLHPVFKASGDKTGKARMSKAGRASFRHIMYNVARNTVMHSEYFRDIYAKHRAKGMGHNQAIGVLMHKVTRIVFGVLKSGNRFDNQLDKNNIKNSEQKRKSKGEIKKEVKKQEELIGIAESAPCSPRYIKKEKAKLRSQDQSLAENEITETSP